jgi:hypothetical protein
MGEPGINQKVYTWAHSHLGHRVGKGECWDLPDLALKSAEAASSTTTGKHDDYVWGDPIGVHQVSVGDILQFRDHVITIRSDRTVTFDDGTGYTEWHEELYRRPHHSAVVATYHPPNSVVVIEQLPKKGVVRNTVNLSNGELPATTAFRSVKDKQSGKMRHAKVEERITVKVTGKVWAYRPKAKDKAK